MRSIDRSNAYLAKRLKAENPPLLRRVECGELSMKEAAIRAGIIRRYFSCIDGDVESAARKLLKHYDREQLVAAISRV
ncbi:hypothetical protein [Planctomycetes bacterium TBK1r]|uniref:HTH cro/C1-type domain-containing protein n=1 Tax=Stieleria magnilauensis TaxID=2527963 RepID=A0ABX5XYQ4_9BACT|nr:hypothetical protein TBK1r_62010 [Planctomycetes bacterium TBK1r]